jgi:hypothetical protein
MDMSYLVILVLFVVILAVVILYTRKGRAHSIKGNIEKYDPCLAPRNVYFNCVANCGNDTWCTDVCKRKYYQAAGISLDCLSPF